MTPEESKIIHDIFDRIRQMGPAPQDPDARAAVERELRANPDALIGLVRAVVALDRERAVLIDERQRLEDRVAALEQGGNRPGPGSGGGLFGGGGGRPWGSPPWGGSGPTAPEPQSPWGRPGGSQGPGTQGGGLLQTALGAAAGMAGGLFAYEALKGLFGGHDHGGSLFGSAGDHIDRVVEHVQVFDPPIDVADSGDFRTGGGMDDFFGGGDDSSFS